MSYCWKAIVMSLACVRVFLQAQTSELFQLHVHTDKLQQMWMLLAFGVRHTRSEAIFKDDHLLIFEQFACFLYRVCRSSGLTRSFDQDDMHELAKMAGFFSSDVNIARANTSLSTITAYQWHCFGQWFARSEATNLFALYFRLTLKLNLWGYISV